MESSGADRLGMGADVPTRHQSNQQDNNRTSRTVVVQIHDERDGRSASESSAASASCSRSEGTAPRVNYLLINRSPPPTITRRARYLGESSAGYPSNQGLRELDFASRGVRARVTNLPVGQVNASPAQKASILPAQQANVLPAQHTNAPPTVQAASHALQTNDPPAQRGQTNLQFGARVNSPQVERENLPQQMPVDLTVHERLQQLERENKQFKVALEKIKELEAPAVSCSGSGRTNHLEFDNSRRWNEVIDDRWQNRGNRRRSEEEMVHYQSRGRRDNGLYDRRTPDGKRDSQAGTSRMRHKRRVDRNNDRHSKRSRHEREHSKSRTDLVRNERIRRETESDSEKDEVLSKKRRLSMIGHSAHNTHGESISGSQSVTVQHHNSCTCSA